MSGPKIENPLESNRFRIYRFDMVQVFLVMGGAMSMAGSNIFPEGCYFRGAKIEDEKLLLCLTHMSWEPIVDGNIPIFDACATLEPPPAPEKPKSGLLLV